MSPGPVATTTNLASQHGGPVSLVVDVLHEGVLDRDPTLGLLGVLPGCIEELVDLPTTVDRDEFITQLIVGGMQGDGQGDGYPLLSQRLDTRHETNGRDRQGPGTHANPVGPLSGQGANRSEHRTVIGHRLAHTHEDDVVNPAAGPGNLSSLDETVGRQHLAHDLSGGHVALDTALPGRAERAGHAAAGLGGDAQGGASRRMTGGWVMHENRLHQRPAM